MPSSCSVDLKGVPLHRPNFQGPAAPCSPSTLVPSRLLTLAGRCTTTTKRSCWATPTLARTRAVWLQRGRCTTARSRSWRWDRCPRSSVTHALSVMPAVQGLTKGLWPPLLACSGCRLDEGVASLAASCCPCGRLPAPPRQQLTSPDISSPVLHCPGCRPASARCPIPPAGLPRVRHLPHPVPWPWRHCGPGRRPDAPGHSVAAAWQRAGQPAHHRAGKRGHAAELPAAVG